MTTTSPNRSGELRGGLESEKIAPGLSGEDLMNMHNAAVEEARQRLIAKNYLAYQKRAADGLVRRGVLSDVERADPRYFECRACGMDPHGVFWRAGRLIPVRDWFWPLEQEDRRELVILSRKVRRRFFVTNVTSPL